MKVVLYVNSSMGANTVPWHTQKCWSTGYNALQNPPIIESSDSVLNPKEEKIKRLLEECSGKHNIDYEVFDIARLRGIKTPSLRVVHGKKKPDTITGIADARNEMARWAHE